MRTWMLVTATLLLSCAPAAPGPAASPAPAHPPAGPATGVPLRYVALGDSFTIGTGLAPEQAFPARLSERWQQVEGRPVQLSNLATNGFTTLEVLEDQVPRLRELRPERVTLAVGANDLVRRHGADQYRRDLRRLLAAVLATGLPPDRLVVLPQPDWSQSPVARQFGRPEGLREGIVRFNDILREEATRLGARHVDLWPLMLAQATRGELASDGLHPSAAAHQAWATALQRAWSVR